MPSPLKSPPAKIVAGVTPQTQEFLYKCSGSYTYLEVREGIIPYMAKSRSRTSLEEAAPLLCWGRTGDLSVLGKLWDPQKGSSGYTGTMSLPLLCNTVHSVALTGSATGWEWPHQGSGCHGAGSSVCSHCPACSCPLLLSPFPPWFLPGPVEITKQGRTSMRAAT